MGIPRISYIKLYNLFSTLQCTVSEPDLTHKRQSRNWAVVTTFQKQALQPSLR